MDNMYLDSGPMGLSQYSDSTLNDQDNIFEQPSKDVKRSSIRT